MKHVKSERLKKLETELKDLQEWLKLGLVPKKDIAKHEQEIAGISQKITEEKDRLQFLRESGEAEEYIAPKRGQTKSAYTEMAALPDMESVEAGSSASEGGFDLDSDTESEATASEVQAEGEAAAADMGDEDTQDEESYFSDRNRWRRGGIVDPDADEW